MRLPLLLVLLPLAASAERFDHRGAVGLLLGPGLEYRSNLTPGATADVGFRGLGDLGGTIAVGVNGNELLAFARGGLGGPSTAWSATAGYRGYFGYEQLKTFLDLTLAAHVRPYLRIGPRVGGGVQYELSSIAGLYAGFAFQFGFGNGFLFSGELVGGVQLRSYLLE